MILGFRSYSIARYLEMNVLLGSADDDGSNGRW